MVQWESSPGSSVQRKRLIRAFSTSDRDTGSRVLSAPWTGTQVALQDHGQRHRQRVDWFRTTDRDPDKWILSQQWRVTGRWVLSAPWTETKMAHCFLQHHGQRHIETGNCLCFSRGWQKQPQEKTTICWNFWTRHNEASVSSPLFVLQAFGFNVHSGGAVSELWGWSTLFPPPAPSSAVSECAVAAALCVDLMSWRNLQGLIMGCYRTVNAVWTC